jgi:hypothetical protein
VAWLILSYRCKAMPLDLDSYARRAEEFISALDREYHLHFSGQKLGYEVERIYEGNADLFDRGPVESLRELAAGDGEGGRRAAYLLEFAVGGFIGRATAAQEAAIAERETALELELAGERIGYRMLPVEQANEPDPERRQAIEWGRLALLEEHLNPLHAEALELAHSLIGELGWASYRDAYAELRAVDLAALERQTERFLAATAGEYERILDPELQRAVGTPLARTRRADLARFFRAPALDHGFPAERLIPAFAETVAELGLPLDEQPHIVLDTKQRPTKTSRAYCAPVRVPEEVYLVVPRVGGREDYAALFHEGGHAQHYANVDAGQPPEFRYLGDNSVTESFAFLLEHITEDRAWIAERLASADPDGVPSHARAVKLLYLRRYAAKLAYELELHGPRADLEAMPTRYAELLSDATGIEWSPQTWLSDVDGGFYVASYLRAWAIEARWRKALRGRFGERWFAQPEAGAWLRSLWREGQRLRCDELLAEAVGEEIDFASLAAEFA